MTSFFRFLGEFGDKNSSLGFASEHYEDDDLKKQLLKMGIKSENGYIYFNELLYRCMRRKYGNMRINKKMQIFELRTQYKIYVITREQQNKSIALNSSELYNGLVKKDIGVNPFLIYLYLKISYKTWLKHARDELKKERIERSSQEDMVPSECKEREKQTFFVDIDFEKYIEETSEEDIKFDDNCEITNALRGNLSGAECYNLDHGHNVKINNCGASEGGRSSKMSQSS